MDQYRYLLYPIPLHWSAEEAAAALHAIEQLQHAAIRVEPVRP